MSDITEELRGTARRCELLASGPLLVAAADEIERLRKIEQGRVLAFGDDFGEPPEELVPALQKKVRALEEKNKELAEKAWQYDELCK